MIRIRSISLWLIALVMGSGIGFLAPTQSSAENNVDANMTKRIQESYGKLPLIFEVNQGQTDPGVKFLSRGPGYGLFLTQNEAVLALTRTTKAKEDQIEATLVRMQLVGAKPKPNIIGLDPLPGKSHYFIGNDPKRWHANVGQYGKVKYQSVYPGIDLIYYGNQQQLEYDLVVAPGADPKRIRLAFEGVKTLTINKDGQLVLDTGDGKLIQRKPIVYQEIKGERKVLDGRYVMKGKQQVGFQVAKYDRRKPLIIDPVLAYSTYLGGASGFGVAVDSGGNAYITGQTYGLPTPIGYDTTCGSPGLYGIGGCVYSSDPTGDCPTGSCGVVYMSDAFVTKLNPSGTAVLYSTYLGGGGADVGRGIAIDSSNPPHAYVTGLTKSGNFPLQGAYDSSCGCGQYVIDAFVTKLAGDGSSLEYSTYLGGSASEYGYGIAVDASNQAYITGTTSSTDFPTTSGSAQPLTGGGDDAFVTKFNAAGTSLSYSTFLGGSGADSGNGIALSVAGDGSVNTYVTGSTSGGLSTTSGAYDGVFGGGTDGFVAKLSVSGSAFDYLTYLGGNGNDYGYGIALDNLASGWNVYVTGSTASTDFPTTTGAFTGAFAVKLDLDAVNQLVYSINPGGTSGNAIAVNSSGSAFVAGANGNDAFVTQLNAAGTAQVYTYALGGSGADVAYGIAIDGDNDTYVTGQAGSSDFPTTPGVLATSGVNDGFVSKIADTESAVKLSASAYSVNEADGTVTIIVNRIGSTSGEVSVQYSTSNGGATGGSDFTVVTNETITFADGDDVETRTISITNDTDAEQPETFTVTLSNPSPSGSLYLNSPGSAVVTITDNDPGVTFSAAAYTVGEEAGTKRIYVNRTGTAGGAFTVQYATSEGTADEPSDYTHTNGTLEFSATDTQKYFDVEIEEDLDGEPYETINLTLSNPTGGSVLVSPYTATLSIVDNDSSSSPVITGVDATNIGSFSAKIVWTTNPAADSQVEYGTTTAYGSITTLDPAFVTSHSVTLIGLSSLTTYHYRVKSRTPPPPTGDGRLAISADETFMTLDAPPPSVYAVNPSSVVHGVTPSQSVSITGASFVLGATITVGTPVGGTCELPTCFTGAATVTGSAATATTPFVFTNSNVLRFWWPNTSLETGAYTVTVKNPSSAGSYSASLTNGFTVTMPQPTVSSTTLNPVTYGITPSQSITISGSNFVVGSTITISGPGGTLTGTTVSGTTASATTPFVHQSGSVVKFWWANTALPAGTYNVQVVNPTTAGGLGDDLPNGFTVAAPQPTVTSTAPNPVTYGITPNSSITVYGSNFVLGAAITVGSLSGTTVTGSVASATTPFVFVSSGQLKFWWPNTSLTPPGPRNVVVTNPTAAGGLSATLTNGFTVNAPQPTVTSTAPNPVTYGITPNSSITISGSNFVLGATITVGSLSGTTVTGSVASATTPYVFVNSSTLRFWWPNTSLTPPGPRNVVVTNPAAAGGLSATLTNGFTVNAPQPTVTLTTPNPVTYGVTPNSSITISGSNFVLGATITVGSLSGTTVTGSVASATTPYVFVNSSTLRFWWPNTSLSPPGARDVVVTNPTAAGGLSVTLTNGFTVNAPVPTITSVVPSPVTFGSTSIPITINGTNFLLGSTITVGTLSGPTVSGSTATASVPYVIVNSGTLRFWWPSTSLPVGPYDVVVTNPSAGGGQSVTSTGGFVVQ